MGIVSLLLGVIEVKKLCVLHRESQYFFLLEAIDERFDALFPLFLEPLFVRIGHEDRSMLDLQVRIVTLLIILAPLPYIFEQNFVFRITLHSDLVHSNLDSFECFLRLLFMFLHFFLLDLVVLEHQLAALLHKVIKRVSHIVGLQIWPLFFYALNLILRSIEQSFFRLLQFEIVAEFLLLLLLLYQWGSRAGTFNQPDGWRILSDDIEVGIEALGR